MMRMTMMADYDERDDIFGRSVVISSLEGAWQQEMQQMQQPRRALQVSIAWSLSLVHPPLQRSTNFCRVDRPPLQQHRNVPPTQTIMMALIFTDPLLWNNRLIPCKKLEVRSVTPLHLAELVALHCVRKRSVVDAEHDPIAT